MSIIKNKFSILDNILQVFTACITLTQYNKASNCFYKLYAIKLDFFQVSLM